MLFGRIKLSHDESVVKKVNDSSTLQSSEYVNRLSETLQEKQQTKFK